MGDQARANAGGMPRPANAAKRSRTQGIHHNRRIDAHLRFARTRAPFALGGANARPHRRPVRAGVLQQARLRFLVCLSPFTPICQIDRPPGCLAIPTAGGRRSTFVRCNRPLARPPLPTRLCPAIHGVGSLACSCPTAEIARGRVSFLTTVTRPAPSLQHRAASLNDTELKEAQARHQRCRYHQPVTVGEIDRLPAAGDTARISLSSCMT